MRTIPYGPAFDLNFAPQVVSKVASKVRQRRKSAPRFICTCYLGAQQHHTCYRPKLAAWTLCQLQYCTSHRGLCCSSRAARTTEPSKSGLRGRICLVALTPRPIGALMLCPPSQGSSSLSFAAPRGLSRDPGTFNVSLSGKTLTCARWLRLMTLLMRTYATVAPPRRHVAGLA